MQVRNLYRGILLVVVALTTVALAHRSQAQEPSLYWINSTTAKILRADLGGAQVDTFLADTHRATAIALDQKADMIYWAGGSYIIRARLNGAEVDTLAYIACGSSVSLDIELDLVNEKVYWSNTTDCGEGILGRNNFDGTDFEVLPISQFDPASIAVDVDSTMIYWSNTFLPRAILRADFEGTFVERIVGDSLSPGGIALDLTRRKIYWTNNSAGAIQRANLDGTGFEDVLTGLTGPSSLALDVAGGKMYWTEQGRIRRANLNGTEVEDLITGLTSPGRLALIFESNTAVGVESVEELPEVYRLGQNYPNPFNPITTIPYALKEDTQVTLTVYNVLGQQVATLIHGFQQAGYPSAVWDGRNTAGTPVPSGMYFYRLVAGDFVQARTMVLLR